MILTFNVTPEKLVYTSPSSDITGTVFVLLPHDNYQYHTKKQEDRGETPERRGEQVNTWTFCQQVGNPTAVSAQAPALHGLVMWYMHLGCAVWWDGECCFSKCRLRNFVLIAVKPWSAQVRDESCWRRHCVHTYDCQEFTIAATHPSVNLFSAQIRHAQYRSLSCHWWL